MILVKGDCEHRLWKNQWCRERPYGNVLSRSSSIAFKFNILETKYRVEQAFNDLEGMNHYYSYLMHISKQAYVTQPGCRNAIKRTISPVTFRS